MGWKPEDFASPEVKAEISRLDTAAVTPDREAKLLALAARLEKQTWGTKTGTASADLTAAAAIVRLAAKPADEGVREGCAAICDRYIASKNLFERLAAANIKSEILALSTTGEPKR